MDTLLWAAYDALADLFTRLMNYRTVGKVTALSRLSRGSLTALSRLSHGSLTAPSRLSHGSLTAL